MFRNQLYLVTSFLVFSCFILVLPETGIAGIMMGEIGCCKTVDQPPLVAGGECVGCEGGSCYTSSSYCAEQGGFFDVDLGCTTTPDGAVCAEIVIGMQGCCVTEVEGCVDEISLDECENNLAGIDVWVNSTSCSDVPLCNEPPPAQANVPTISHMGLLVAAVVLGVIGFAILRKRQERA